MFSPSGGNKTKRTLRGRQNPFLFPCRKKKRFLESKEKGAFENWGAVGCPAAACVFPPPSGTSPGRYGLCGRNREKRVCCLPAAWVGTGRGVVWRANQGPRASPAQRVAWGEDEQGSGARFRRQAETERSGLCEDDVAPHTQKNHTSSPVILRPKAEESASLVLSWRAERRGNGSFAALRMTRRKRLG